MLATHLKKNNQRLTPYKLRGNFHSAPTPLLYKMSSDPRHQQRSFNVPMMDTLIQQELKEAIWYDADTDQLINLYFPPIVTDDIVANNVTIMKWQAAWCKLGKVKTSSIPDAATSNAPSTTSKKTPALEKSPTPKHRISVWLTQVCHELTLQINPSKPPKA